MTEFPKISRKKSVTNDLHQQSSPTIVINDPHQRSSSTIVINNRRQQSSLTIVIRDPGAKPIGQGPKRFEKSSSGPASHQKNLQNPGPDQVQSNFLMVRGFLVVIKIDVAKIYIPHSLMVLLPRVGPRIVKNMPFSGFTGPFDEFPSRRRDPDLHFYNFVNWIL